MEYVARIILEVNGQQIDDWKKVSEKKVENKKAVNLARKTGFVKVTPRYLVDVDYVIPFDGPVYDFSEVSDGTLTIDFENGARRTFTGVHMLTEGDTTFDGENEAVKTIEFGATGRVDQ